LDHAPVVENEKLRQLFDYWLGMVSGLTPPRKADIDPMAIPRLLPHIWIQEHVPGTTEFRCRLAGEDVKDRYAVDIIGPLFSEVIGDKAWALVSEQYMLSINTPGICHSIGPVYMHTIERMGIGERILMPLQNNEGVNAFILGATIYAPLAQASMEQQAKTPRKTFTPLSVLPGDTRAET